jgi:hypothetical protein
MVTHVAGLMDEISPPRYSIIRQYVREKDGTMQYGWSAEPDTEIGWGAMCDDVVYDTFVPTATAIVRSSRCLILYVRFLYLYSDDSTMRIL